MKTKKYLAALLALVMLLSILPMAAFAAENVTCGHADVTREYGEPWYVYYSTSQHHKFREWDEVCNTCFETDSGTSRILEDHLYSQYTYSSDSEEGEEYRHYYVTCACGYEWDEIVFGYEGYPTP